MAISCGLALRLMFHVTVFLKENEVCKMQVLIRNFFTANDCGSHLMEDLPLVFLIELVFLESLSKTLDLCLPGHKFSLGNLLFGKVTE